MEEKIQFKVKFFGTKERKGQVKKVVSVVTAATEEEVMDILVSQGWLTVHSLRIRKID